MQSNSFTISMLVRAFCSMQQEFTSGNESEWLKFAPNCGKLQFVPRFFPECPQYSFIISMRERALAVNRQLNIQYYLGKCYIPSQVAWGPWLVVYNPSALLTFALSLGSPEFKFGSDCLTRARQTAKVKKYWELLEFESRYFPQPRNPGFLSRLFFSRLKRDKNPGLYFTL
jgi:hypothetical protein